jgi:hypothetical protein
MFTPDGELREEFRHLEEGASPPASEVAEEASPSAPAEPMPRDESTVSPTADSETQRSGRVEIPTTGQDLGEASFFDLVGVLAQPIALYLGDAKLPDGESAEDLNMARLYIDLLDILRKKTTGNLSAQELTFLEDLLYQLRMRYVQKRG